MSNNTSVGILGAGISGLSVAYALQQEGIPVTVYEKSEDVGGAIHSIQTDGWLVEEGPNTLMVKSKRVWDLLKDLELEGQIIEANKASRKRYVIKNEKPVAIPTSIGSFLTTPLLSASAKLRLFKEPFVPASDRENESVADYIERRLGKQLLDYGVNPFVSGIYAGDPKELSIKHTFSMLWEMEQRYGSITKGMFRRERTNNHSRRAMISFQEGNQTLPIALANSLGQAVQTANIITSVEKVGNQWQVKGSKADGSFLGEHKCLVSTLPTHILSSVFESDLFNELSTLPYTPVSVLALGFKEHEVAHPLDGFGMLIPEIEHFKTLGVLFSSTLFPNRAPKGHALLTCFIGGARNPKLAQNSQKVLTKIVLNEIGPMLDISGTPVFCHHKFWPKGIPQYNLGHEHYLTAINKIEEQSHGLYLDGNFRNGVSVPDCISSGFETAKRVLTFL